MHYKRYHKGTVLSSIYFDSTESWPPSNNWRSYQPSQLEKGVGHTDLFLLHNEVLPGRGTVAAIGYAIAVLKEKGLPGNGRRAITCITALSCNSAAKGATRQN
jgi:hypothetical protein